MRGIDWPSGRFLPAFVLGPLTGVLCGYLAASLIMRSRAYCDAGNEPGHRFALIFFDLPALMLVCALAAWIASGFLWCLVRPASWKAAVFTVVPISLEVGLLIGWAAFASLGTLDGYPGDSGLCPASNIPPWWPSWLPA
ncbi:hypothetical protein OG946_21750 [Streptomyces sp. NBC_01808]|uniref:hypothetical protein n=1 Tax=Streptomyces sp. NBC_01808 TaxID=2975947 RepID=UPI002DDC3A93|nr:hypothetical protein [Streptomyces sp. NBC_01808]WSA39762.1 hypothetical protein OG946_21750 [Streptomyces sp. NBC_01808]